MSFAIMEPVVFIVCRVWPTDRPDYWNWDIEDLGSMGNAHSGPQARRLIGDRLVRALESGQLAPDRWPVIHTLRSDPRRPT